MASLGSSQPEAGSQRREESRVLAHLTVSTVSNWPQPYRRNSKLAQLLQRSKQKRAGHTAEEDHHRGGLGLYLIEECPNDYAGEVDVTLHRQMATLEHLCCKALVQRRWQDVQTCRQL